ncbi:DNA cytosine methyltransferase [Elizabethkingia anophelis]|nr:DNA cytosine methyltransferase [Elizabethkingia anophelis]MCT3682048.1 DNA cytosine methyltransferase [Elizabethkingia anophelis]
MKILNLYACVGGNRKLWSDEHEITAVELKPDIAAIYKDLYPNDKVIIGDANKYLLDHYSEYDFIWLSRPCTTHSRANFWASRNKSNRKKVMPDLTLYSEILFLQNWYDGLFVAENVKPYYTPLLPPSIQLGRHLFWSNFEITPVKVIDADIHSGNQEEWRSTHGIDLSKYKIEDRKDQVYRNLVHPETGLHILNCALNTLPKKAIHSLFDDSVIYL